VVHAEGFDRRRKFHVELFQSSFVRHGVVGKTVRNVNR
jgi:hypothetical protein